MMENVQGTRTIVIAITAMLSLDINTTHQLGGSWPETRFVVNGSARRVRGTERRRGSRVRVRGLNVVRASTAGIRPIAPTQNAPPEVPTLNPQGEEQRGVNGKDKQDNG